MVLEEKIKSFSNFAVLEVVVDGKREGTYDSFSWWQALKMAELSYFSRLLPSTVGRAPRSAKYGDLSKSVKNLN